MKVDPFNFPSKTIVFTTHFLPISIISFFSNKFNSMVKFATIGAMKAYYWSSDGRGISKFLITRNLSSVLTIANYYYWLLFYQKRSFFYYVRKLFPKN